MPADAVPPLDRNIFKFDPTDFEFEVIKLLETLAPPGQHAAKNALWHLNRAWKIHSLDPEMAYLRAVTAEEEAASALFASLKRRHYQGADKLRRDNHGHKCAVVPFFEAVARVLDESLKDCPLREPPAVLVNREESRLQLVLSYKFMQPDEEGLPEPPLNFEFTASDGPLPFAQELERRVKESGAASVERSLTERVKRREQVLYAVDTGINRLQEPDVLSKLQVFRAVIFRLLTLTLLIDPYAERSPFIQMCLDAFVQVLESAGRKFFFVPRAIEPNPEVL
jgi:hypothetical protein